MPPRTGRPSPCASGPAWASVPPRPLPWRLEIGDAGGAEQRPGDGPQVTASTHHPYNLLPGGAAIMTGPARTETSTTGGGLEAPVGRRQAPGAPLQAGIEDLPQGVAEHLEGEDGEEDAQPGGDDQPGARPVATPWKIIEPQSGAGGCVLIPMKESEARERIAPDARWRWPRSRD